MNDDYVPSKAPAQNSSENIGEDSAGSVQVFDISADSISPVNDESEVFVPKKPVASTAPTSISNTQRADPSERSAQSAQITRPSQIAQAPKPTKPYISPDTDLLDKKIGTFDTTPFAPSASSISSKNISQSTQSTVPPIQQEKSFVSAFDQKTPQSEQNYAFTPPLKSDQRTVQNSFPTPTSQVQQSTSFIQKTSSQVQQESPQLVNRQTTPQQPINLVPKKPSPIPLQDIFIPNKKASSPTLENTTVQQPISRPAPVPIQQQAVPTPNPVSEIPPSTTTTQTASLPIAKSIRTYEGDVAEAMSHKKTSTASIAIAESKKQSGKEEIGSEIPNNHSVGKIILTIISLVLVIGGAIGAYYLYTISPLAPAKQKVSQNKPVSSIVPSNSQTVVEINKQSSSITEARIMTEIAKAQKPDTIKEIILAEKNQAGSLVRISSSEMVNILDIDAPDILIRSLADSWMLGVHTNKDSNKSVFVVVTSSFFQNTFAGMLQWENVMIDELKRYLPLSNSISAQNYTDQNNENLSSTENPTVDIDSFLSSTDDPSESETVKEDTDDIDSSTLDDEPVSTTTEETTQLRPYFTLKGKFEDRILKNKDVREFRTDSGEILFLYSFIDNNKLVITSSESVLEDIITRLEKQLLIR